MICPVIYRLLRHLSLLRCLCRHDLLLGQKSSTERSGQFFLFVHFLNYHVFRLYTVYVHYVHYMFIICSLYGHYMFIICSLYVHYMFIMFLSYPLLHQDNLVKEGIRYDQMIRHWCEYVLNPTFQIPEKCARVHKERSALSSQMRFHSVFVTLCWKCSLAGGNIHHSLVSTKSGDASLTGDAPVQVSTWSASYLWQVGSAFCAVNNTDPYRTGWDSAFPSLDAVGSAGWSTWINSQSSWILVSSSQVPWFPPLSLRLRLEGEDS